MNLFLLNFFIQKHFSENYIPNILEILPFRLLWFKNLTRHVNIFNYAIFLLFQK